VKKKLLKTDFSEWGLTLNGLMML